MIKEALQYIAGLKEPHMEEINGGIYADKEMIRITTPLAKTAHVTTLTAMLDYIQDNVDCVEWDKAIINIISPTEVHLISALNADGNRDIFISSKAIVPRFDFGRFYDSESFNIAIQAMFADNEDKFAIIRLAGNLMEEAVKTSIDDGMTQNVVIRTGVKVVGRETVPNPVTLKPYRTFMEVEQPASEFIFRIQDGSKLSLFEADGGAWRNEAAKNIKEYLVDSLEELGVHITILA